MELLVVDDPIGDAPPERSISTVHDPDLGPTCVGGSHDWTIDLAVEHESGGRCDTNAGCVGDVHSDLYLLYPVEMFERC